MDKILDITKILEKTKEKNDSFENNEKIVAQKVTNPILKKLMSFKNQQMSKSFDINDLLR